MEGTDRRFISHTRQTRPASVRDSNVVSAQNRTLQLILQLHDQYLHRYKIYSFKFYNRIHLPWHFQFFHYLDIFLVWQIKNRGIIAEIPLFWRSYCNNIDVSLWLILWITYDTYTLLQFSPSKTKIGATYVEPDLSQRIHQEA